MHAIRARLNRARESFWMLPALGILTGAVMGLVIPVVDGHVRLPDAIAFSGGADTARSVLAAIATIGVSTAGVSFSVLVVALVLASQQLSPRVLRSFQRHALNQAVLGLLLGLATFALFGLGSIGEREVPELTVTLAMVLAAGAFALFVAFLHHAVRSLNASVVIRRIAADGHAAIAHPFPHGVGRPAGRALTPDGEAHEVRAPRAGYVASVDGQRLLAWAERHDALVEQVRAVGEFTVTGAPVARVWGGPGDEREVARAFVISEERLVDGDVAFPVRQLVDIALKGLSPALNDPTTAENAMDSVADTLVRFAMRDPPDPVRADDRGVPRLLTLPPTLDDLVRLAFDQVRRDAANRPSFAVRLLELLADLRETSEACRGCREIDRQAALIADHAATLADEQADQRLVTETYERLHEARVADHAAR